MIGVDALAYAGSFIAGYVISKHSRALFWWLYWTWHKVLGHHAS